MKIKPPVKHLLDVWKTGGIGDHAAKQSERFHELGLCLERRAYFDRKTLAEKSTVIDAGVEMAVYKTALDYYLETNNYRHHGDAIKFLVMLAAVMASATAITWDRRSVRDMARNLQEQMKANQTAFKENFMPRIEKLMREVDSLSQAMLH